METWFKDKAKEKLLSHIPIRDEESKCEVELKGRINSEEMRNNKSCKIHKKSFVEGTRGEIKGSKEV